MGKEIFSGSLHHPDHPAHFMGMAATNITLFAYTAGDCACPSGVCSAQEIRITTCGSACWQLRPGKPLSQLPCTLGVHGSFLKHLRLRRDTPLRPHLQRSYRL